MTGAEYKEGRGDYYRREGLREYADVLRRNGYVVLTREKAEKVRENLLHFGSWPEDAEGEHDPNCGGCEALALLTPEREDVGPPAPGEGDDYPNPEIGMQC